MADLPVSGSIVLKSSTSDDLAITKKDVQDNKISQINFGSGSTNLNGELLFKTINPGSSDNLVERMRIHTNGYVGIGITEPKEKLEINGSIRGNQSGALRISTGSGYVDIGPQNIYFSHFYTDRPLYYFNKEISVDSGRIGSYDEDLYLLTSGTERIRIKSSDGNVGIGTPSPQAKLSINGGLHVGGDSDPGNDNLIVDGNSYFMGNVGIGTPSNTENTSEKLTIQGNSSAPYALNVGGTSNAKIKVRHLDGKDYQSGKADNLYLQFDVNYHTILNGGKSIGNVGIGTPSPRAKLSINGGLHVGGDSDPGNDNLTVDGNSYLMGNVGIGTTFSQFVGYAGWAKLNVNGPISFNVGGHNVSMIDVPGLQYFQYIIDGNYYYTTPIKGGSSKRFKTNITELELDSGKIYDLGPISFNWIDKYGGKRDFGLIAEEVEKAFPLLIDYDIEGKVLGVKYELLSVLLLNELKKKNIEIGNIKEEMEEFKVKLAKLESAGS